MNAKSFLTSVYQYYHQYKLLRRLPLHNKLLGSRDTACDSVSGLSTFYSWMRRDCTAFRALMVTQCSRRCISQLNLPPPPPLLRGGMFLIWLLWNNCYFMQKFWELMRRSLEHMNRTLLFFTSLRISTFFTTAWHGFDVARNLTKADVVLHIDFLSVRIKWAENIKTRAMGFTMPVYANAELSVCPLVYVRNYLAVVGFWSPSDPFFRFNAI